jgi:hypothetical protein
MVTLVMNLLGASIYQNHPMCRHLLTPFPTSRPMFHQKSRPMCREPPSPDVTHPESVWCDPQAQGKDGEKLAKTMEEACKQGACA